MAKSIRSKIKRKHRAEFRSTIGEAAYQANMEKIQTKLKESVGKQSLDSLNKVSSLFESDQPIRNGTDDYDGDDMDSPVDSELHLPASPAIDAAETTAPSGTAVDIRGENKAPISKRFKGRKHKMSSRRQESRGTGRQSSASASAKPRPRFFCQF